MTQPDLFNPPDDALSSAKIQLLMSLRSKGILDHALLSAIESVPREVFTPKMFADHAYANQDIPIAMGQMMPSPYHVAYMLQALELGERNVVLEIGTGSGYQAAILSHLVRRVFTLEYYRELRVEAYARLEALGCESITSLIGNGYGGWKEAAPYDRIIVTAAMPKVPSELLEQLADEGIMIIAIGEVSAPKKLLKIQRDKWNYHTLHLGEVSMDVLTHHSD